LNIIREAAAKTAQRGFMNARNTNRFNSMMLRLLGYQCRTARSSIYSEKEQKSSPVKKSP